MKFGFAFSLGASILLSGAVYAGTPEHAAHDRTARIYDLGKTTGTPLFVQTIHTELSPIGIETRVSTIKDSNGATVMTELAVFQGLRLFSQNVAQLQTGLAYEVRVDDGRVTFRELKANDAHSLVSEKSESPKGEFLTGPLSENFVREHWDSLVAGEQAQARFGVLELGETVGFSFRKKGVEKIRGREVLVLEMKPSSLFISLMVDPIELSFDMGRKELVRYKGRTPLSRTINGKRTPIDAEIFYE